MDWKGKKVVILGAARQGTALAAYLASHGAKVTLSDTRPSSNFVEAQEKLSEYKIKWKFGEQNSDLIKNTNFLSISGGVPPENPLVLEARKRAISITNDSQIFLDSAPCPVVGITGSAGKTTTTMLVGRMLAAMKNRSAGRTWMGGNIGNPLISVLDDMKAEDIAVMELSSFQLEIMDRSPHVAVLLNLAPNHLDRHESMADYVAAKIRIFEYQSDGDISILAREDFGSSSLAASVKGTLWTFGLERQGDNQFGSYLSGKDIWIRNIDGDSKVMPISLIALRGEHNLLNVLAACCIAASLGASKGDMQNGVENFNGAPHRLELVRSIDGVDWFNDSIATSPQRSEASLRSFDRPVVLLAGGRDKGLNWESFASLAGKKAKKVMAFGEAANHVESIFSKVNGKDLAIETFPKMDDALNAAKQFAKNGDVVLLAPGGTSFDEFEDFEARGLHFREMVNQL